MSLLTEYKLREGIDASQPMIEVEGVSVRYRIPQERIPSLKEYAIRWLKRRIGYHEFWALREVSLKVYRGEAVGIIGPNGAGKSTLLKVIARVLRPTAGRVRVQGRVAPLLELGAGFDAELTGRENIFLNGMILGYSQRDIEARFDRIVDFAGLHEFIDAPLRTYSTGMVARLGFSVATDVQPEILIVDEILGVGDLEFQKKSSDRITSFCNNGATILLVSHSLEAVQKMCDRVVWLEQGKVRAMGPAFEVSRLYHDTAMQPFYMEGLIERWGGMEQLDRARQSGAAFDEYYFQYCCGEPYHRTPVWMRFFNQVAENIATRIAPQTVLDAGCAKGFLVELLHDRGIQAFGVDISSYAIDFVRDDLKAFCKVASLAEPYDRRYDLIVCIEVLQNLTAADGERAVANFCQASDDVLISVNPADRRVPTYVNVQPLEYWENLFAQHGFGRDANFDASFITPWAMRFRKKS